MASTPTYTSTLRTAFARTATGNTARDGSGTITSIITGVAAGTRILEVRFKFEVTSTAGMVRLFRTIDAGTTWRMLTELPVSAITVGASTIAAEGVWFPANLWLKDASAQLGFTTHNSEAVVVWADGADLT